VTPAGDIVAIPLRGAWTGNRGILHRGRDIVRFHAGDLWITCALRFKDRHQEQWRPGHYTFLFFHDEAVSFAAGHRPCAECRRSSYNAYRAAWPYEDTRADAMDLVEHADRLDGRAQRTFEERLGALPDGTLVAHERAGATGAGAPGSGAFLLWRGALRPWTPAGYGPAEPHDPAERVMVLTPRVTVEGIRRGYAVCVHSSGL